jgi:hypothetical protein
VANRGKKAVEVGFKVHADSPCMLLINARLQRYAHLSALRRTTLRWKLEAESWKQDGFNIFL